MRVGKRDDRRIAQRVVREVELLERGVGAQQRGDRRPVAVVELAVREVEKIVVQQRFQRNFALLRERREERAVRRQNECRRHGLLRKYRRPARVLLAARLAVGVAAAV